MTAERPECTRHYLNLFMDSRRWDEFEARDGDIIVCTPYKSGTTWVQMICALLVFKTTTLPRPLAEISPWLDLRVAPVSDVLNAYARQTHRRIIKTHTPLDGLPYFDKATYLYCARDPREIFISMWNHGKNQRVAHLIDLLKQQGIVVAPPPQLSDDINERFQLWCTKPAFAWERDGFPFWSVFSHANSFWRYRDLPNVHFLHYADLKSDLAGQMARIAKILGIGIDATAMPALVAAATFAAMKKNGDMTAPDTNLDAWNNNADFFNKGEHAQWRGVLSEDSLALYESVKRQHGSAAFLDWMERGFLATGLDYP